MVKHVGLALLAALLWLSSPHAKAAIAIDAKLTVTCDGAAVFTPNTCTGPTVTAAATAVVVTIVINDTANPYSTCTYNSFAMHLAVSSLTGGTGVQIWYATTADGTLTGAQTISCAFGGGSSQNFHMFVVSFTGTAVGGAFASGLHTANALACTSPQTVPSVSGNAAIDACGSTDSPGTPTQTLLVSNTSGVNALVSSWGQSAGATVSFGWVGSGTNAWAALDMPVPGSGGGGVPSKLLLMGVGQ